jgi:hypothetical protein
MRDIEFASHGITCRGWLCPPESEVLRNERGYPALVMAHGTSGVRQQHQDQARLFSATEATAAAHGYLNRFTLR